MAVSPYREKLVPFLDSIGSLEVRRLKAQNHFHSEDWQGVDAWLTIKEAEGKVRAEERAEESLSISRKALLTSKRAYTIAISAITLSIIMAIKSIIEWLSK